MKKEVTIKVNLQQIILNDKTTELKELDVWVDDHIEYDDQNQEVRKKIMEAFTSSNII